MILIVLQIEKKKLEYDIENYPHIGTHSVLYLRSVSDLKARLRMPAWKVNF